MNKTWESDYIDLSSHFLKDADVAYLEGHFPHYKKNVRGCPTCSGSKNYQFDGKSNPCECSYQVNLYKHYLDANIGITYQRLDWDDYKLDPAPLEKIESYLSRSQAMIENGMGVLFYGPNGNGKTLLSSLLAKELVKLGYSVYFATFSEMIDKFTRGWGDTDARNYFERKIVQSDIFVLDDVGKEYRAKTGLAESTFDHILRNRVIHGRPVIMTTNLSLSEMEKGYGASIFSLIKERSLVIEMNGEDYRGESRKRSIQEILEGEQRPIY